MMPDRSNEVGSEAELDPDEIETVEIRLKLPHRLNTGALGALDRFLLDEKSITAHYTQDDGVIEIVLWTILGE